MALPLTDCTLSLHKAVEGTVVHVVTIHGGYGLQRKLSAMGLVTGQEVKILRNRRSGPVVIEVMGSRFMIGRGMAYKVVVQKSTDITDANSGDDARQEIDEN
jgi:Fe2+ transport system protein FeoA